MTDVAIELIEECLLSYEPDTILSPDGVREAAVAAILRQPVDKKGEPTEDTEALFILRAIKEGDPWSGHMAFPGGHREPQDGSLRETAERETLEEIGLDLVRHARFLGEIESVHANPRGRDISMVVTPFVYVLETQDPAFNPNYEVAEVLWGSLVEMYRGESLTQSEFEVGGQRVKFPGYSVGDHVVWGLTLRMLDQFFGMLDPEFEHKYERRI